MQIALIAFALFAVLAGCGNNPPGPKGDSGRAATLNNASHIGNLDGFGDIDRVVGDIAPSGGDRILQHCFVGSPKSNNRPAQPPPAAHSRWKPARTSQALWL